MTASRWRVVGEELLVVLVVVALSAQLIDRGDDVFWSATTELPNPQTFLPVVIVAIMVVIVPFFTAIIVVMQQACLMVRAACLDGLTCSAWCPST